MFYKWLLAQRERRDSIGGFANLACTDRKFPRTSRLHKLLDYCGTNAMLRDATKKAHAEFRAARAAAEEGALRAALASRKLAEARAALRAAQDDADEAARRGAAR